MALPVSLGVYASPVWRLPQSPVKWAIAGRNADKLAAVNRETGANVEIIIAKFSEDDVVALEALTARTKVVLSTAGPFIAMVQIWSRLALKMPPIMSTLPARILGKRAD